MFCKICEQSRSGSVNDPCEHCGARCDAQPADTIQVRRELAERLASHAEYAACFRGLINPEPTTK